MESRYTRVEEKVAMFLSILAHHKKNRFIGHDFIRNGHSVSTNFHEVLRGVLKLHPLLVVKPTPVAEDFSSETWKWFKGCLGALDGTYVTVLVSNKDKPRYKTRKGTRAINVLACCDMNMNFTYSLVGWEGSAADARVLRDAIHREDGLKIPRGFYYLCDKGYANVEGFLTPFRRTRYHIDDWATGGPENYKEYYNSKYFRARKVIERAFGLLKRLWKDPLEGVDETINGVVHDVEDDFIDNIESSSTWDLWRENLALSITHYLFFKLMQKTNAVLMEFGASSNTVGDKGKKSDKEKRLMSIFPGTDLRGCPYINSKIHVWKKTHGTLATMLSRSGIGWNETQKMIESSDEAWEGFVKTDPSVRTWRYKSWPYFADWIEIFGFDRENGQRLSSFTAAVQQVLYVPDEVGGSESHSVANTPSFTTSASKKSTSKKRKQPSEVEELFVDAIKEFIVKTTEAIADISKRLSQDYEIAMPISKDVLTVLQTIPGLTRDEKQIAAEILVEKTKKLALLFNLEDDEKLSFVKRITKL
ncbi:uncharacterized protein [Henckelia pumila]|uniref:uncharacterized protein n=1 Tax=Henckelia pumila TaxID=405737 RepID=UPI003C6DC85D